MKQQVGLKPKKSEIASGKEVGAEFLGRLERREFSVSRTLVNSLALTDEEEIKTGEEFRETDVFQDIMKMR